MRLIKIISGAKQAEKSEAERDPCKIRQKKMQSYHTAILIYWVIGLLIASFEVFNTPLKEFKDDVIENASDRELLILRTVFNNNISSLYVFSLTCTWVFWPFHVLYSLYKLCKVYMEDN